MTLTHHPTKIHNQILISQGLSLHRTSAMIQWRTAHNSASRLITGTIKSQRPDAQTMDGISARFHLEPVAIVPASVYSFQLSRGCRTGPNFIWGAFYKVLSEEL